MRAWTYVNRACAIAGLYIVLGQWASTVAGSGAIEGWLILRPEFTTPSIVMKAMIEGLVQGVALALWIARPAVLRQAVAGEAARRSREGIPRAI